MIDPVPIAEREFVDRTGDALAAQGIRLSGLTRKMVDLSEECSYCWAGGLVEATVFHRTIVEYWNRSPKTHDSLRAFIDNYPPEDARTLQVIAVTSIRGMSEVHVLNTSTFIHESGRKVALIGQGTEDGYSLFDRFTSELTRPFNSWNLAMMLASLFNSVSVEGSGSRNAWGGGFEARCDDGRGLRRFDRVLSVLFRYAPNENGADLIPISEFFCTYSGEIAVFFSNWTTICALPHVFDPGELATSAEKGSNGMPVHFVAGFILGMEPFISYVEADVSKYPISLSGQAEHRPAFNLDQGLMSEVWEAFNHHHGFRLKDFNDRSI